MRKKGFTIVEIILYLGLLSIFLLVLLDLFTGSINIGLSSQSSSVLNEDNQYILSRLMYDAARADTIVTPSGLGTTSNTLVFTSGGVTYTYTLTSGNLTLSNSTTTQNLNSLDTSLTNISFKRLGNVDGKPTVQVIYTIQSNIKSTTSSIESRDMQITVGTR